MNLKNIVLKGYLYVIHAARRTDLPILLLHNVDPSWDDVAVEQALKDVDVMKSALMAEGHPVYDCKIESPDLQEALKPYDPDQCIVLNWCEELPGCPKSDAVVAAILTDRSYTYTGSTPEVLAMSWQKTAVKEVLQKNGITTPAGRVVFLREVDSWDCFPAIVKPSLEHCSIGVTAQAIVFNHKELREQIAYVEEVLRQPALVEDFISGRELHVSVWGNRQVEMFPPAEMDFSALADVRRHLCTYDSKFIPGSEDFEKIEMIIPALLDVDQEEKIRQVACDSFKVLGCRDYARIDLRLKDDVFYVLDVNPNADLSPETSTVFAAAAVGITYGQFASGLVNLAAQRHPVYGPSFVK